MPSDNAAPPDSRPQKRSLSALSGAWPLAALALVLAAAAFGFSARAGTSAARQAAPVFPVPPPTLSPDDVEYLDNLGPVGFCADSDWEPYEKIDASGAYVGIAADLFRLIAARAGVRVQLVPTADWKSSLAASRAGECLLLAFLNETPERKEWLDFTDPYFIDPNVFITRTDHDFIADPAGLTGKTIVLPEGTSLEELVRSQYPNLQVVVVESELDALSMVEERKADMTVRSLTMAAYVIRKEGRFNLRISGQLPEFRNEFRIGVAKDEPRLRDILNRGVRSLKPQEVQAIVNAHIPIEARTGVDNRPLYAALGVFLVVSLVWLSWTLSLRRHTRHLRLIIDTVPAFIFVKDRDGRYLLANRWTATAFGVPPEEVAGLTDRDCRATEEEVAAYLEQDRRVLESGEPLRIDEHPGRRVDGSPGWFQTIKVPYRRPGSRSSAILGVTQDITELKLAWLELEERERRFRRMAQHDGLTDLPNRALFSERLAQAMSLCRRERKRLALGFLDLDHFKEVNDGLGHAVGDGLLKEAASRMKASLRSSDTVGRIGGDEFVFFLPGVSDRDASLATAEKIRAALERPFELAGERVRVSASVGLSLFPDDGEEETVLTRRADAAMYRSKARGRNRVSAYDPELDAEAEGGTSGVDGE
jgi:diguanylate cyclase (GGDEF)-like protein/PAS domain S-box-containing protein